MLERKQLATNHENQFPAIYLSMFVIVDAYKYINAQILLQIQEKSKKNIHNLRLYIFVLIAALLSYLLRWWLWYGRMEQFESYV